MVLRKLKILENLSDKKINNIFFGEKSLKTHLKASFSNFLDSNTRLSGTLKRCNFSKFSKVFQKPRITTENTAKNGIYAEL